MNRFLSLLVLSALLFLSRAESARGDFGTVITTYPFAPSKVLADPMRDRVYAILPFDNTLRVINTLDTSVSVIQLPVDSIPVDMALSSDNSRLYIANSGSTVNAVSIVGNLDASTPTLLTPSIRLDGPGLGIAATVDANSGDDILFVLTAETLVTPPAKPGGTPTTKAITPILVVDGTTGGLVKTIEEDGVTHNLVGRSFDGKSVVVAGSLGLETFSVASGKSTGVNPTIGKDAIQFILSNTGKYFCVPDPAGNSTGTPFTTLLFDGVNPPGYYGTFNDEATPGPVSFAPDDSLMYQLRFDSTSAPELLVFDTAHFVETATPVALPVNDATLSAKGRNTMALDRSGSLLFVGLSTSFQSDSPGLLLVVSSGVVLPPVIISSPTANGTQGTFFTYQTATTNTVDSYSAIGLPSGLAIDPVTGIISGTPTVVGTFAVTIGATNSAGTGTATLTITIANPAMSLVPAIGNTSLPDGVLGQIYTAQITATNSPTSFDATGLPAGLTIDPTSGIISGTPTVAAVYTVTVSATNVYGTGMTTLSLTITPNNTPSPVVTSATTASATAGTTFSYQITATNSPTSYAASGTLPAGLGVDTSTGLISGVPQQSGTFNLTISATNAGGTGAGSLALTVTAPVPVITDTVLSASVIAGQEFTYTITAANNPTSFGVLGLPGGLTVDAGTGVISGAPTDAGVFNLTLQASNAYGTGTATFMLTVTPAQPIVNIVATVARVTAGSGDDAELVITRTGDTSSLLFVYYTLSGDARNGTDFEMISAGKKKIKPGRSSAVIHIVANGPAGGSARKLKVKLLAAPAYLIGNMPAAKVKIVPGE